MTKTELQLAIASNESEREALHIAIDTLRARLQKLTEEKYDLETEFVGMRLGLSKGDKINATILGRTQKIEIDSISYDKPNYWIRGYLVNEAGEHCGYHMICHDPRNGVAIEKVNA